MQTQVWHDDTKHVAAHVFDDVGTARPMRRARWTHQASTQYQHVGPLRAKLPGPVSFSMGGLRTRHRMRRPRSTAGARRSQMGRRSLPAWRVRRCQTLCTSRERTAPLRAPHRGVGRRRRPRHPSRWKACVGTRTALQRQVLPRARQPASMLFVDLLALAVGIELAVDAPHAASSIPRCCATASATAPVFCPRLLGSPERLALLRYCATS